jgi:hypothetical protein
MQGRRSIQTPKITMRTACWVRFSACTALVAIALHGCDGGTMEEMSTDTLDNETVKEYSSLTSTAIPETCTKWFDGCNSCSVKNGREVFCTRRGCPDEPVEPRCEEYDCLTSEVWTSGKVDWCCKNKHLGCSTRSRTIPETCTKWFDGCNMCTVKNGRAEDCQRFGCPAEPVEPRCAEYDCRTSEVWTSGKTDW